ncbi:ubiquitin-specific protease otu1 [Sorochytrium milnesiophthora]
MRLRLRTKSGTATLLDDPQLTPESPLGALRAAIATTVKQQQRDVVIKSGFPPRPVTNSDTDSLATCGIHDGSQVIVDVAEGAGRNAPVAAPALPPQETRRGGGDGNTVSLPTPGGGLLVRRAIADDNNCLFESVRYVVDKQRTVDQLRKLVVTAIRADPSEYSEAVLGRPVDAYCAWISKNGSWGGAIELAIFAKHYRTEICSVDVQTTRVDRFGEGMYPQRACVLYSGIHYDAVAVTPTSDAPSDFDTTVFDASDDQVLIAARQLAEQLKKRHLYTDVANFSLRCDICRTGLVGHRDAQGSPIHANGDISLNDICSTRRRNRGTV